MVYRNRLKGVAGQHGKRLSFISEEDEEEEDEEDDDNQVAELEARLENMGGMVRKQEDEIRGLQKKVVELEVLEPMRELMGALDTDGNGKLDAEELAAAKSLIASMKLPEALGKLDEVKRDEEVARLKLEEEREEEMRRRHEGVLRKLDERKRLRAGLAKEEVEVVEEEVDVEAGEAQPLVSVAGGEEGEEEESADNRV